MFWLCDLDPTACVDPVTLTLFSGARDDIEPTQPVLNAPQAVWGGAWAAPVPAPRPVQPSHATPTSILHLVTMVTTQTNMAARLHRSTFHLKWSYSFFEIFMIVLLYIRIYEVCYTRTCRINFVLIFLPCSLILKPGPLLIVTVYFPAL